MKKIRSCLTGYVRVRLWGNAPERFLNLCSAGGLELWAVECRKDGMYCCIRLRDLKACRPYLKKSGVRLRILGRHGVPFFLERNRGRKLWAAGFVSFFLILWMLSRFVWGIEYVGNTRYTDDQLAHSLKEWGVSCGVLKSGISCEELEEALRAEYEGLTWVSVRLAGTKLTVHVKENEVPMTREVPEEEPCDLAASCAGTITRMIVRSGVPLVKAGDTVEEGQLLVSGTIPITDDAGTVVSEHRIHADADIIARRKRTESHTFSLWHRNERLTGRERRGLSLAFGASGRSCGFVWLFPNLWGTEWRTVTDYQPIRLPGDFYLPIRIGHIRSMEISSNEEQYTNEELSRMAQVYKSQVMENLMEKGVHIIENNVKILVNGSVCRFEVTLETEESILTEVQGEQSANEYN